MNDFNFHIVLYQPEIPANTGNVGRLCVGCKAKLHIIKPMRFLITDKYVKRAGLDYWDKLQLDFYDDLASLQKKFRKERIFFCTTKSPNNYTQFNFRKGDVFIFGPESRGIPDEILQDNWQQTITIPMNADIRSINLANSVAIISYEAWRQIGFVHSKSR